MILLDEEVERLKGAPHDVWVLFILLRAVMHVPTSTTGEKSAVSWFGLHCDAKITPHQGVKLDSPSEDRMRRCGKWLERIGLAEFRSVKNRKGKKGELVKVFFPVFDEVYHFQVQKKAASKPPVQAASKPTVQEAHTTPLESGMQAESRQCQSAESRHITRTPYTDKTTTPRARVFLANGSGNELATMPFANGEFVITDADLETARSYYPRIELEHALSEIGRWLFANPEKAFENDTEAKAWLGAWLRSDNAEATPGKLPKASKIRFEGTRHATDSQNRNSSRLPAKQRVSVFDGIDAAFEQARANLGLSNTPGDDPNLH